MTAALAGLATMKKWKAEFRAERLSRYSVLWRLSTMTKLQMFDRDGKPINDDILPMAAVLRVPARC